MKPLSTTIPALDQSAFASLLSERDRAWLDRTMNRCRSTYGDLLMMAGADDSGDDGDSDDDSDDSDDDADDQSGADKGKDHRPKDSGRAGGPDALKADLTRERRARQAAEKRLEALEKAEKDRNDAELSELEKARKEAKEAQERAERAELRSLKSEVALEKGLPAKLAGRLTGSTRDELEDDADELVALLGAKKDSAKDGDSADADQGDGKEKRKPKPDRGQGGGDGTKRKGLDAGLSGYQERFARVKQ